MNWKWKQTKKALIGIPPLKANIGGQYLVNKHILENIENSPIEEIFEDDEIYDEYEGFESEI